MNGFRIASNVAVRDSRRLDQSHRCRVLRWRGAAAAAVVLLLAHGLVHLLYVVDDVPEFSMDRSWLVSGAVRRPVALGLLAATIAAFALLALGVWGLPGLSGGWPGLMAAGCLLSMVLLLLFWSPWLVVGLVIDIGLLALAVIRPDWVERLLS